MIQKRVKLGVTFRADLEFQTLATMWELGSVLGYSLNQLNPRN